MTDKENVIMTQHFTSDISCGTRLGKLFITIFVRLHEERDEKGKCNGTHISRISNWRRYDR